MLVVWGVANLPGFLRRRARELEKRKLQQEYEAKYGPTPKNPL